MTMKHQAHYIYDSLLEWTTVIVASAAAVLTYAGKSYVDRKEKARERRRIEEIEKKEMKMIDGLKSWSATSACMEHMAEIGKIGRVFLLEISNDGKMPKPGSKIYARAIDVKFNIGIAGKVKHDRNYHLTTFNEWQCDDHYVRMVTEIAETQAPYIIDTETHEDCALVSIYKELGIKHAEVHHIYADTEKWCHYIISIASYKDEGLRANGDTSSAVINNNIALMRSYFRKYR